MMYFRVLRLVSWIECERMKGLADQFQVRKREQERPSLFIMVYVVYQSQTFAKVGKTSVTGKRITKLIREKKHMRCDQRVVDSF